MKAWVLHDIGDIRYEDVPKPVPAAGEVLVKVGAAGICGSDIPRIYNTGAHRMPLIPGHEFAGTVEAVGACEDGVDKASSAKWIGKRVGVFPLIPCHKCFQCLEGRYELCRNYDYVGSRRDGAFSEYVCVPGDNLVDLPDSVSMEEAAMLEPMAVAVHAIRLVIDPKNGDRSKRVAVYGLGAIGLFITMFLRSEGFNDIIVIGNKEYQKQRALEHGIDEGLYFDGRSDRLILDINNTGGVDITFECVGKSETFEASVAVTRPMGTVVTVGNPYGDMTLNRDIYWKILRNQLTITGTWNSSFVLPDFADKVSKGIMDAESDDWHYVLGKLRDKAIDPASFITHRFSLDDLDKGLAVMKNKSEEYGKIIVSNP